MQPTSGRKPQLFIYLILSCIALQQLYILNSNRIAFLNKSTLPFGQSDSVAVYEKKLVNAVSLLPPKSKIGYIQDSGLSVMQGHIFLSQYAMAPRLLQEKSLSDTVLANFPISGTIEHPNNPLYTERKNWLVLKDFKNGFFLIRRK